jgi:hypothetical protein
MTECNIFCYSKEYNDENSFQQKRYRAFNKEVGETRYYKIRDLVNKILKDFKLNLKDNSWSNEWKKVSQEQWEQLLAIPEASDFKEGFEYISGVKIEEDDIQKAIRLLEDKGIIINGKIIK